MSAGNWTKTGKTQLKTEKNTIEAEKRHSLMPAIGTRSRSANGTPTPEGTPAPPNSPSATTPKSAPTTNLTLPGTPSRTLPKAPDETPLETRSDKQWQEIVARLEERVVQLENEVRCLRGRQEGEEKERITWERKAEEVLEKVERRESAPDEWKNELKETEKRILDKLESESRERRKKRCVLLVDSNGRNAITEDSVKQQLPSDVRDDYEIKKEVTYRMDEAYDKIKNGKIDVTDSIVVVDCLTNHVRDTRNGGRALTIDEFVQCVHILRLKLWEKGAAKVVVCEIKPTGLSDVAPYNMALHKYLRSRWAFDGGHGCQTQIRLEHLGNDKLHVLPQFFSVLQQTYAFAILRKDVPSPTPFEELTPYHLRTSYREEWPNLQDRSGRVTESNHGWTW